MWNLRSSECIFYRIEAVVVDNSCIKVLQLWDDASAEMTCDVQEFEKLGCG